MKIFYFCSTGTYASLVAAYYHLGVITDSQINFREIMKLEHYNSLTRDEIGQPISVGKDEIGNEIFTFGVKGENILLTNAFTDWLDAFKIANSEYKLVDLTKINENYLIGLGIYLSNTMGIKNIGGLIGAYGLISIFPKIVDTVNRVKGELA